MAKRDTKLDNARNQAKAQYESIEEMVETYRNAETDEDRESASQTIQDDPLSVQVRGGWRSPGTSDEGADEYMILLCTGGPAVRLVGDLSSHSEPETVRIEYQDWFTPWTDYPLTREQEAVLLEYAQMFYFGD